MEFLHGKGLVHRDLKQDNICFGKDGNLKLIDLGLAAQFKGHDMTSDKNLTLAKARGNPTYQAPECLQRDVIINGKADVWALGLIIAELLCGWYIDDSQKYEGIIPNQNEKKRLYIRTCKGEDAILGKMVQKMLIKNVKTRWSSTKLVQELDKHGVKEIRGNVVDTGFTPQVSKEWIDNLYNLPVKSFKDCLKSIDEKYTSGGKDALAKAKVIVKAHRNKTLTIDEIAAINLYTQTCLYKHFNECLRNDNMRKEVLDFARLLVFGLDKLPNEAHGVFYRVVNKKILQIIQKVNVFGVHFKLFKGWKCCNGVC